MEDMTMSYVFVRYEEEDEEEGYIFDLVKGEKAKSPEAFIEWLGNPVKILCWFELPGHYDDILDVLLTLDWLAENPVVSDLIAAIFNEGYRLGLAQKKEGDLKTALRAFLER